MSRGRLSEGREPRFSSTSVLSHHYMWLKPMDLLFPLMLVYFHYVLRKIKIVIRMCEWNREAYIKSTESNLEIQYLPCFSNNTFVNISQIFYPKQCSLKYLSTFLVIGKQPKKLLFLCVLFLSFSKRNKLDLCPIRAFERSEIHTHLPQVPSSINKKIKKNRDNVTPLEYDQLLRIHMCPPCWYSNKQMKQQ